MTATTQGPTQRIIIDVYDALTVVVVFVILLAAAVIVAIIVMAVKLKRRKSSSECTLVFYSDSSMSILQARNMVSANCN